jgi:hypothetical protein
MFKEILQSSVRVLLERPKIIRLAFLTLFCFSVVRLYYIIYYFNNILIWKYEGWVQISDALMYFITTLNEHHALITVIIAVVIIIVWYLRLYPIGQASIVYALHEPKNSNMTSFMKWMNRFFPMLEYWGLSIPFWLFTFATVLIRVYLMDIYDNIVVQFMIWIWWITVVLATMLRQYAEIIIALEWCPVFDAIKKSTRVAASNIGLSFKLMLVELILLLRFFIIWAIIVWIPLWLVYIAVWLDILNNSFVEWLIWVVCWALIIILAYINCIIESFFITYWYKAYMALTKKE